MREVEVGRGVEREKAPLPECLVPRGQVEGRAREGPLCPSVWFPEAGRWGA